MEEGHSSGTPAAAGSSVAASLSYAETLMILVVYGLAWGLHSVDLTPAALKGP
jgi:hypothetical protein